MATLEQLKSKFKSIDFGKLIEDSVVATKGDLIEYQRGQMLHGLNSSGSTIGKYRSKDYARRKANMNPVAGYGNVDLKLTGEFQRNLNVRFFARSFFLFSTDSKMKKLTEKYGDVIWGLSPSYTLEYSNLYIADQMNARIKKFINGL